MELLRTQFAAAVSNVTITGTKLARAIAAHTEVRVLLETDPQLRAWGIDSILIGSYARQTARYPGKDVDVFLRFKNLSVRHDPEKVFAEVERVLVAAYGAKEEGGRVTIQARSLKIDFNDEKQPGSDLEFSVDAVPAVPWGDHWGIPNRDRELWRQDQSRWILTDPIEFADVTNELATSDESATVGGNNAYRPVVRLLRQIRHIHLGEERPGGLFTEIAAYESWTAGDVGGDQWAPLLANSITEVAARFLNAESNGMLDPILKTALKPELEASQWRNASDIYARLGKLAQQALDENPCMAAMHWREILGTNDRGQVLPLPEGCRADGTAIVEVSAVSAVGSNEPRGFA